MLHILLIILKIIGILLLVLLGLLLICLIAILFVPIRYNGDGQLSGTKDFGLHMHIHWLLHIVSIWILYEDEFQFKIKIFGFSLHKDNEVSEEEAEYNKKYDEECIDANKYINTDEHLDTDELIKKAEEASQKTDNAIEKAEETAELLEKLIKSRSTESEQSVQPTQSEQSDSGAAKTTTRTSKKKFAFNKTGAKKHGIKKTGIANRIKKAFHAVCKKVSGFRIKIKEIEKKRQFILAFLQDEENRYSIKLIKYQLKRLLKHIFPKKIHGNITFGVEDPYFMGQILSVAAFFYPLYGKQLLVTPIMNTKELNGEVSFRGRLQVGVLVYIALRIWMNKNIRTQFHNYRNRGGR